MHRLDLLVRKELARRGIRWEVIERACQQIVLFGSSALSDCKMTGDIDLLCVGTGTRLKNRHVDLVWYSPTRINEQAWLGSELANHIAHFGKWLHGTDNWTHRVFVSNNAIRLKRRLIVGRARGLERLWDSLRPEYRKKHATKLRRDIQRLRLLKSSAPIVPSPVLDQQWRKEAAKAEEPWKLLITRYRATFLPRRQLRLISDLLAGDKRGI